jgi:hypothetical protein
VLLLKKGGNAGDISTLVRVQVVVEQSGFVRSTSTRLILNQRKQLRLQEKKKNNNFRENACCSSFKPKLPIINLMLKFNYIKTCPTIPSSSAFKRINWEDIYRLILSAKETSYDNHVILDYFRNKTIGYDGSGILQRAFSV